VTFGADDVRAAARAIAGAVVRTPTVPSRTLSALTGATVHLKLENLQFTASFKERGALNKLLSLTDAERSRGVIAVSAGNHAQAVAHHGSRLGIATTIVMPVHAPFIKIRNTEQLGARVVLSGDSFTAASAFAASEAAAKGLTFVHPYDDALVAAGQGTLAIEMLEDAPAIDTLVVPIGGGGLIAGCAVAAQDMKPGIEVVGVEAALYPSMQRALAGLPAAPEAATIADGIAVKVPGALTLPVVRERVADILLVGEAELEQAVQLIAEIEKLVAEGAGAAPLAALLAHPARFAGRTVGLVLSGGNIDARLLSSVLMRGLVRSGRLVRLRVQVSDQAGSLGRATQRIGELGGNIVEIQHQRWFRDVPVRLAEVDVLVEVMDPAAARAIAAGLDAAGMPARILSDEAADG